MTQLQVSRRPHAFSDKLSPYPAACHRQAKWRGHFYVHQKQVDGSETRLREIIARQRKDVPPAPVNVTLRWFYETAFCRRKEQQWRVTSRPRTKRFIENYLLWRFGNTLLGYLDKSTLQTYLNEMAPRYSKSVLSKIRVYLTSMLDEAVELEMLPKNPAGKLAVPKSGKRKATAHLTAEEIPQIFFRLSDRDHSLSASSGCSGCGPASTAHKFPASFCSEP